MSPRSASSRAGTSRSSDVPAPEPTRTASLDLIAAFPQGLFCRECGRRAARASNQELGVVHKLCLCPGRCNGQLWRHEPAAYGSVPCDHAHRLGDRRRAFAQCHAAGGQRRAQALRKPAEDEAVHTGVGTAAADGGSQGDLSGNRRDLRPGRSGQFAHPGPGRRPPRHLVDRKSTRLNSSHGYISYAVFCLKKKKTKYTSPIERPIKKLNNKTTVMRHNK